MLDIKRIREDYDAVKAAVERRGNGDFGIGEVFQQDKKRRELLAQVEQMKNRQSVASKEIPKMKKEGLDAGPLLAEMKTLSEEIKVLDGQVAETEDRLKDGILNIPNTPTPMCRLERMIRIMWSFARTGSRRRFPLSQKPIGI